MGTMYTAVYFPNGFPPSTGIVKATSIHDWVDSTVNGIGNQNAILYCRAMPTYKLEDFYQYFTNNEILWYKFFILTSGKIYRMYQIKSNNLVNATTIGIETFFPTFAYTLNSFVTTVTNTLDNKYRTFMEFNISY